MCTIETRLKILRRLPFLQSLPSTDFDWINSLFYEKDFNSDEVICLSGDAAEKLFIIAEGRVRLIRHSLTGKNILLDLLIPGEFFGALSGLGNEVYPETAEAHSPCCILVIDKAAFTQIITRYPTVALKVIDIMTHRLQMANERVHQLSVLPVEGRIASLLLNLGDKLGIQLDIGLLLDVPLSREDLAEMTGTTTETASRLISRFQKDGLIRAGRGWVAIIKPKELEAIAGKEQE